MTLVRIRDGEEVTRVIRIAELTEVIAWERIGDDIRPYFADDPERSAFPNDGRMPADDE